MATSNKEWAHACAARGWLVFPSYQKKPLVRWGTQATTDPSIITEWWDDAFPAADVCIKTGVESNLVVLDWDAYKQDDPEMFPLWEDRSRQTYTALTPKGGYHFYYTHPGFPVSNSAGTLAEYVDVRGDGGMVVAYPPVLDVPLAFAPERWLTKRNTITEQVAPICDPYTGDGDGLTLAVSLLEGYAEEIANAPEGTLNTTLWMRASDAYKMVAAGELSEEAVRLLLYTVAVHAGHPQQGAAQTIQSARNRGMLEPTSCVDVFWRSKGR